MVVPLVFGVVAGGAGLSLLSNQAAGQAADIAGEVVEESFALLGIGLVRGAQGAIRAIKEEAKGHGVEITATITAGLILYFFVNQYIK